MLVLLYRCLRRPFVGEFVTQKSRRCSIFPARTGGILLMSSTLKAQWRIQRSFQHVSAWRNVIWSKSPLLRPSRQMMGRGLLNWWSAKCVVSPCSFHGAVNQNKYPCPGCLNHWMGVSLQTHWLGMWVCKARNRHDANTTVSALACWAYALLCSFPLYREKTQPSILGLDC